MQQRTLALVGPGRAGTAIAVALVARGWTAVGVAGRHPERAATLAARLDAPVRPIADPGAGTPPTRAETQPVPTRA